MRYRHLSFTSIFNLKLTDVYHRTQDVLRNMSYRSDPTYRQMMLLLSFRREPREQIREALILVNNRSSHFMECYCYFHEIDKLQS